MTVVAPVSALVSTLLPIGVALATGERPGLAVAIGAMVPKALNVADKLAKENISVEVIDPRTLVPLDLDAIVESVARTHRLVVAREAAERLRLFAAA